MKLVWALVLSSLVSLQAAFNQMASIPSLVGTGLAGVASRHLPTAFVLNPALSAVNPHFFTQLYYASWFSMKELQTSGLVVRGRLRHVALGGYLNTFGNGLYRETTFQIAAARRWFGDRLAAGLAVQLYHLNIHQYGVQLATGIHLGFWYQVSAIVSLGGVVTNVNEPRLSGSVEEIPYRLSAGIALHPISEGEIVVGVSKTSAEAVEYRIGVSYWASDYLSIYTGLNSIGPQPAGGVALRRGGWALHYTLQYHFVLGPTHLFSVTFSRGSR